MSRRVIEDESEDESIDVSGRPAILTRFPPARNRARGERFLLPETAMWIAIEKFVAAIFNGAPSDELGKYTAQTTALIGLYICFIAIFLTALFLRRLLNRPAANRERNIVLLVVTCAALLAFAGVAIHLVSFLIDAA